MIVRVWRAQIDGTRAGEYERFARETSRPMFEAQSGFSGVLFGRSDGECMVITLWEDEQSADSLESSPSYLDTVFRIREAGFIAAELGVERFQLHGVDHVRLPDPA